MAPSGGQCVGRDSPADPSGCACTMTCWDGAEPVYTPDERDCCRCEGMTPVTLSSATQTSLTVKWPSAWRIGCSRSHDPHHQGVLEGVSDVRDRGLEPFEDGPPKVYTIGEGSAAATSHEIDGLSAGTWYDIKIRAVIQSPAYPEAYAETPWSSPIRRRARRGTTSCKAFGAGLRRLRGAGADQPAFTPTRRRRRRPTTAAARPTASATTAVPTVWIATCARTIQPSNCEVPMSAADGRRLTGHGEPAGVQHVHVHLRSRARGASRIASGVARVPGLPHRSDEMRAGEPR